MRSLLLLSFIVGCDRSGREFVSLPIDGYPGVVDLGEVPVVDGETWANSAPSDRRDLVNYHVLGPPEPGTKGGATATFMGNGETVCVFADPEAVSWNQSVAATNPDPIYFWPDNWLDDGDIELDAGLSAYYTGSPGLEIGSFEQVYEDALGTEVAVDYAPCIQVGLFGQTGAHAGRGTAEFCEFEAREGRLHTILLETWSLPIDDQLLGYGFGVVTGTCDETVLTSIGEADWECVIRNENDPDGSLENDEYETFEVIACLGAESLFCACTDAPSADNSYCTALKEQQYGFDFDFDNNTASFEYLKETFVVSLDQPSTCGDWDAPAE